MPVLSTLGAATAKAWGFLQQVASAATDPFFEYVTMLLTGDGTNGAQNNTFLDSSTNNFTVTRNGNTTQGSFSPYGANWGNFFDGTGDYLSTPSISLAGDFTIEGWFFRQSGNNYFFTVGDSATSSGIEVYAGTGGTVLNLYSNDNAEITATPFATTTWSHLAVVRSGTTITMYVNGTSVGTWTSSATFSGTVYVGAEFYSSSVTGSMAGYISNFRIVNGTAVYTTTFTPSTTPLTAITNTQLLTCQSNRFIDNSTNAYTVTVNGNTSIQRFSPFSPTASYDTATIGGSGYFNGSGDSLLQNTASNWTFISSGASDWTIEFDVYYSSTSFMTILDNSNGTSASYGFSLAINNDAAGKVDLQIRRGVTGSNAIFRSNAALKINQWNHVAVTFTSSTKTATFYINGVQEGSTAQAAFSYTSTTPSYGLYVGVFAASSGYDLIGNLANLRISDTLRTGLTTVPTSPYSSDGDTKFLLNFTNAGIPDSAMMNDLETVGSAQVSTSVVKYGTGSLAFDGTGDWLVTNVATNDLYAFGAGNFTIEMWLYVNSVSTFGHIYDSRPTSTDGSYPCLRINGSNELEYVVGGSVQITSTTISTSTWYHVAIARSATSTKLFVNGTQSGSTYTDSTNYINATQRPLIGGWGYNTGGGYSLDGYIDDLRITKGVARYTTTFTAPTAAFPTF
jgi:hypothetical protein